MLKVPEVIITYKALYIYDIAPEDLFFKIVSCLNSIGVKKERVEIILKEEPECINTQILFPLHHYLSFSRAIKLTRALEKFFEVSNFHYDVDFDKLQGSLAAKIIIRHK